MQDWIPWAERNEAPSTLWGTYSDPVHAKGCLHTTETDDFTPQSTYFRKTFWPHATIKDIGWGQAKTYNHIPSSRAARALQNLSGGVQTNNDRVFQIEIVYRAANAPFMPRHLLDEVGRVMRWAESQLSIKRMFFDDLHFYPPEDGVRLNGNEPWRMPPAVWDNFNGWCGHQNVPENLHGDPGKLDLNYLLNVGVPSPPPQEDSVIPRYAIVKIPPVDEHGHQAVCTDVQGVVLGNASKFAGFGGVKANDDASLTGVIVCEPVNFVGMTTFVFKAPAASIGGNIGIYWFEHS